MNVITEGFFKIMNYKLGVVGYSSDVVRSLMCDGSSDRCPIVDCINSISFQPVLHDWYNKGCGILSCLWNDAYKRTLAASRVSCPGEEEPAKADTRARDRRACATTDCSECAR